MYSRQSYSLVLGLLIHICKYIKGNNGISGKLHIVYGKQHLSIPCGVCVAKNAKPKL